MEEQELIPIEEPILGASGPSIYEFQSETTIDSPDIPIGAPSKVADPDNEALKKAQLDQLDQVIGKNLIESNIGESNPFEDNALKVNSNRYGGLVVNEDLANNPNILEHQAADTQSYARELWNDTKVAGVNFTAMAASAYTGIYDMFKERSLMPSKGALTTQLANWRQEYEERNGTFQSEWKEDHPIWNSLMPGEWLKSTAYGLGMAAGMLSQDAIITLATAGTGTIPAVANNIRQLFRGAKFVDDLANAAVKSASFAKQAKAATSVSKLLGRTNNFTKGADVVKTLARSYIGAMGEAEFEANEARTNLYAQFSKEIYDKTGYFATEEELNSIADVAEQAHDIRFALNAGMLMRSNAPMLKATLSPFSGSKALQTKLAEKGLAPILDKATGTVKLVKNTKLNPSTLGRIKALNKLNETKFGQGVFKVSKLLGNKIAWSEGVEEAYQFLVDKGTENYYTSLMHDDHNLKMSGALFETLVGVLKSMWDEKGTLLSDEGLASFVGGLGSGAGQALAVNPLKHVEFKRKGQYGFSVQRREKVEENLEEEEEALTKLLKDAVNVQSAGGTITDKLEALYSNYSLANQAQSANNPVTHELLQKQAKFKSFYKGLKNGQAEVLLDIFKDQVKGLTIDEFNEMTGSQVSTEEQRDAIIEGVQNDMKEIAKSVERVENTFKNPFSKETPLDWMRHEQLKEALAYHDFMYRNTAQYTEELTKDDFLPKDTILQAYVQGDYKTVNDELLKLSAPIQAYFDLQKQIDEATEDTDKTKLQKQLEGINREQLEADRVLIEEVTNHLKALNEETATDETFDKFVIALSKLRKTPIDPQEVRSIGAKAVDYQAARTATQSHLETYLALANGQKDLNTYIKEAEARAKAMAELKEEALDQEAEEATKDIKDPKKREVAKQEYKEQQSVPEELQNEEGDVDNTLLDEEEETTIVSMDAVTPELLEVKEGEQVSLNGQTWDVTKTAKQENVSLMEVQKEDATGYAIITQNSIILVPENPFDKVINPRAIMSDVMLAEDKQDLGGVLFNYMQEGFIPQELYKALEKEILEGDKAFEDLVAITTQLIAEDYGVEVLSSPLEESTPAVVEEQPPVKKEEKVEQLPKQDTKVKTIEEVAEAEEEPGVAEKVEQKPSHIWPKRPHERDKSRNYVTNPNITSKQQVSIFMLQPGEGDTRKIDNTNYIKEKDQPKEVTDLLSLFEKNPAKFIEEAQLVDIDTSETRNRPLPDEVGLTINNQAASYKGIVHPSQPNILLFDMRSPDLFMVDSALMDQEDVRKKLEGLESTNVGHSGMTTPHYKLVDVVRAIGKDNQKVGEIFMKLFHHKDAIPALTWSQFYDKVDNYTQAYEAWVEAGSKKEDLLTHFVPSILKVDFVNDADLTLGTHPFTKTKYGEKVSYIQGNYVREENGVLVSITDEKVIRDLHEIREQRIKQFPELANADVVFLEGNDYDNNPYMYIGALKIPNRNSEFLETFKQLQEATTPKIKIAQELLNNFHLNGEMFQAAIDYRKKHPGAKRGRPSLFIRDGNVIEVVDPDKNVIGRLDLSGDTIKATMPVAIGENEWKEDTRFKITPKMSTVSSDPNFYEVKTVPSRTRFMITPLVEKTEERSQQKEEEVVTLEEDQQVQEEEVEALVDLPNEKPINDILENGSIIGTVKSGAVPSYNVYSLKNPENLREQLAEFIKANGLENSNGRRIRRHIENDAKNSDSIFHVETLTGLPSQRNTAFISSDINKEVSRLKNICHGMS